MAYGPARLLPGGQIRITTNPDTEPLWQTAKEHKLTACQCGECGHFRMPPTAVCPECGSREKKWPALPGTATVFSYVVCNKNPKTVEDYVYVPVVVALDGAPGARLDRKSTRLNSTSCAHRMPSSA